MAQPRQDTGAGALGLAVPRGETDDWGPEPPPQIDLADDLRAAVKRAATAEERLVVVEGNDEIAAISPIEDYRLLLRLEVEELDRIDAEEMGKRRQDPDNQELIPWETIKAKHSL